MVAQEDRCYQLLDAGNEKKLEQIGPYRLVRQAAQAYWPKSKSDWLEVQATHHRSSSGGGHWQFHKRLPETWITRHGRYRFHMKLTDFGHLGLFPEQEPNWQWLAQRKAERVLNLFGYTGGSTLAAATSAAEVTHVDASKGAVSWARDNFAINSMNHAAVRWITEDVSKYIEREQRRGSTYQGIILDPPSYGRGPRGQVWKIETDLIPLLLQIKKITPHLKFVLLSCHTPGYSPHCLANILSTVFACDTQKIEAGEMVVPIQASSLVLPSGSYARFAL